MKDYDFNLTLCTEQGERGAPLNETQEQSELVGDEADAGAGPAACARTCRRRELLPRLTAAATTAAAATTTHPPPTARAVSTA